MAISPGWKENGPDRDPDPRAVDLDAEPGHQRQQEQSETDRAREVGVAAQHPVVAQDDQRRDGEAGGDGGPHQLAQGHALGESLAVGEVEAVDHHEAQPVEQGDDREHQRVGVGGPPPQHEVEGERRERGSRRARASGLGGIAPSTASRR